MKGNLILLVLAISIVAVSCQKEEPPQDESSNQEVYQRAAAATQSFFEIWDNVYSQYPMSVFCACDCTTSETIQNEVNAQLPGYEGFEDFRAWGFSCQEFMGGIGATCGQEVSYTRALLMNSLNDGLNLGIITDSEHGLLSDLVNEGLSAPASIDFDAYKQRWNSLGLANTANRGMTSYSLIVNTEAAVNYFDDFPNPPIEPTQFLIHKVAGGLFGAWWNITWEVTVGDGIHSGDEYWKTAAGGFIGGAIGSL